MAPCINTRFLYIVLCIKITKITYKSEKIIVISQNLYAHPSPHMKFIVAPDAFKGSLSATQAAEAIAEALRQAFPESTIVHLPVADGGEGTTEIVCAARGGQRMSCQSHNAVMQPITAHYAILPDGTAVIDMAAASGLTQIAPAQRNPMHTTTFGTGEIIAHAITQGCHHIVVGLGGSATCDAGIGMLQALGFTFYNAKGRRMHAPLCGKNMAAVYKIIDDRPYHLPAITFSAACDVTAHFCGHQGAAQLFAAQKGASPDETMLLDHGLRHIAKLTAQERHIAIARLPRAGAAGGMGGIMTAYLNATLRSGIDWVLDTLHFDDTLANTNCVITGEGCIDQQSFNGKVLSGLLARTRKHHIRLLALGGCVVFDPHIADLTIRCITPAGMSTEEALNTQTAAKNLKNAIFSWSKTLEK